MIDKIFIYLYHFAFIGLNSLNILKYMSKNCGTAFASSPTSFANCNWNIKIQPASPGKVFTYSHGLSFKINQLSFKKRQN